MIEIAVVEDEKKEAELLGKLLNEYAVAHSREFNVTYFSEPSKFLDGFRDKYDLVFLDIQMPGMTGMDVARKLREKNSAVNIVFVTNMVQYAVEGYSVQASDFIVKPASAPSVNRVMNRALAALDRNVDKNVTVKNAADGRTVVVKESEIYYVEGSGHKITYHTAQGDFSDWGSMNAAVAELSSRNFARCHVSFLVNLKYVRETSKDSVKVGGDVLPISRTQKNAFFAELAAYLGGGGGMIDGSEGDNNEKACKRYRRFVRVLGAVHDGHRLCKNRNSARASGHRRRHDRARNSARAGG